MITPNEIMVRAREAAEDALALPPHTDPVDLEAARLTVQNWLDICELGYIVQGVRVDGDVIAADVLMPPRMREILLTVEAPQ